MYIVHSFAVCLAVVCDCCCVSLPCIPATYEYLETQAICAFEYDVVPGNSINDALLNSIAGAVEMPDVPKQVPAAVDEHLWNAHSQHLTTQSVSP